MDHKLYLMEPYGESGGPRLVEPLLEHEILEASSMGQLLVAITTQGAAFEVLNPAGLHERANAGDRKAQALCSSGMVEVDLEIGKDPYKLDSNNFTTPVSRLSLGGRVEQLVREEHSCAITSFGNCFTWGANSQGQLGDDDVEGRSAPNLVEDLLGAMRCAASSGSAALTKEGDVIVWGFATRAARPRRVALEGAVVAQIALSGAPWAEAVVKVGGAMGCIQSSAQDLLLCVTISHELIFLPLFVAASRGQRGTPWIAHGDVLQVAASDSLVVALASPPPAEEPRLGGAIVTQPAVPARRPHVRVPELVSDAQLTAAKERLERQVEELRAEHFLELCGLRRAKNAADARALQMAALHLVREALSEEEAQKTARPSTRLTKRANAALRHLQSTRDEILEEQQELEMKDEDRKSHVEHLESELGCSRERLERLSPAVSLAQQVLLEAQNEEQLHMEEARQEEVEASRKRVDDWQKRLQSQEAEEQSLRDALRVQATRFAQNAMPLYAEAARRAVDAWTPVVGRTVVTEHVSLAEPKPLSQAPLALATSRPPVSYAEAPSPTKPSPTPRRRSPSRRPARRSPSNRRNRSPSRRKRSPSRRKRSPSRRKKSSSRRMKSPTPRRRSPSRRPARRSPSNRRKRSPSRRKRSPSRRKKSPSRRKKSPSRRKKSPSRRKRSPSRRKKSNSRRMKSVSSSSSESDPKKSIAELIQEGRWGSPWTPGFDWSTCPRQPSRNAEVARQERKEREKNNTPEAIAKRAEEAAKRNGEQTPRKRSHVEAFGNGFEIQEALQLQQQLLTSFSEKDFQEMTETLKELQARHPKRKTKGHSDSVAYFEAFNALAFAVYAKVLPDWKLSPTWEGVREMLGKLQEPRSLDAKVRKLQEEINVMMGLPRNVCFTPPSQKSEFLLFRPAGDAPVPGYSLPLYQDDDGDEAHEFLDEDEETKPIRVTVGRGSVFGTQVAVRLYQPL
eukprot:g28682.t1